MFKKLVSIVEKWWSYKALYAYDITHEKTLPVILVDEYTQEMAEELKKISQPWWIILTDHDIEHGHDVYSIVLHHIHCRSELVVWENILGWLEMSKEEMRPHLEGHIRHTLIDLREALIQWKRLWDLLPWFTIQADRIWCACGFMIHGEVDHWWSMADTVEIISEKRWIDHGKLYRTLHHGTGTVDLFEAHELLEQLVAYVDTLDKKSTNK